MHLGVRRPQKRQKGEAADRAGISPGADLIEELAAAIRCASPKTLRTVTVNEPGYSYRGDGIGHEIDPQVPCSRGGHKGCKAAHDGADEERKWRREQSRDQGVADFRLLPIRRDGFAESRNGTQPML